MPHASSDERPPYTRPGRGEWMGMAVPNLRRQLRLSVCGQRVRESQSRLKPAPRSSLINQVQSPCYPEENLGLVIGAYGHCRPLKMAGYLHSFSVDV
ncbi:hypothetical protein CEXT_665431 [Caerostris extrusa]|uniref:Uncharacterized protein n=1 Tax=Caerostris extrusa TaxID=172846 RepID=A0AAV4WAI0_CAEEX|nr:hypothetical protein CEXT_665431 [Caerostris extrusa]